MTTVVFVLMVLTAGGDQKPMFSTGFDTFEACAERVEYLKARGTNREFFCMPQPVETQS